MPVEQVNFSAQATARRRCNAPGHGTERRVSMQAQRRAPARVTYFIQGEGGGPIKIGISTRAGLQNRLSSIQTGHPDRLVVRIMRGNREREMHLRFAHLRLAGEWFHADGELAEVAHALAGPTLTEPARAEAFREGYIAGWVAATKSAHDDIAETLSRALAERLDDLADSALADAETLATESLQRIAHEADRGLTAHAPHTESAQNAS